MRPRACAQRGGLWGDARPGAPLLSALVLVTSQTDEREQKSSHRNSQTAQPRDPAAGNQEKQRRKTKTALFGERVQVRARACSYGFRAGGGTENFARARLFAKVPSPAPGSRGPGPATAHMSTSRAPSPASSPPDTAGEGGVSSVVSAGARQARRLSSPGRRLETFRAGGALPALGGGLLLPGGLSVTVGVGGPPHRSAHRGARRQPGARAPSRDPATGGRSKARRGGVRMRVRHAAAFSRLPGAVTLQGWESRASRAGGCGTGTGPRRGPGEGAGLSPGLCPGLARSKNSASGACRVGVLFCVRSASVGRA